MKLSPVVEPLLIRDWYEARRVILACFPLVSPYSLRRALCRDRQHSGVVRVDGQVVAVINLTLPDASTAHWLGPNTLWVQSIAVSPPFRGRGIGRTLMDWAKEYALRYDFSTVALTVQRNNPAAIDLYERLGYTRNEGGQNLGMSLALPDAADRRPGDAPASTWRLPERLRLLPEHLAFLAMSEFQDHIAPWFNLDPLVSTIDRR